MIARGLLVGAIALLLGLQVVRNAAVAALSPLFPEAAAKFWSDHPDVTFSRGLTEIGAAARAQRPISDAILSGIYQAAARAPLAPEPYLVRGVAAQVAGDADTARRAFLAAQNRDPRSMAAAYFLADYYFRADQPLKGLEQTALLARLSPAGVNTVAPFVAAYARERANWPEIRALFRSEAGLEANVLDALARDAGNADALLALASPDQRRPDKHWVPVLLNSLVAAGDYRRARAIWLTIGAGRRGGDAFVFDGDFANATPPPPFNWKLASSTIGIAEREPGKRLHAIFYGNQDGVIATQLLLLAPGAYRMELQVVGAPAHAEMLRWSLRCANGGEVFAAAAVDEIARGGLALRVPAGCPAQWLELSGRAPDIAQQAEVTMTGLRLTRVSPDA